MQAGLELGISGHLFDPPRSLQYMLQDTQISNLVSTSAEDSALGRLRTFFASAEVTGDAFSTVQPPTQNVLRASSNDDPETKPTCSLSLICYRSGAQGCITRQIRVALRRKYDDEQVSAGALEEDGLIWNDEQFFADLHKQYEHEMCSFWRRKLSLKTLRKFRLLSYTALSRPKIVPMDDVTLQEVLHEYRKPPSALKHQTDWIEWVFRLRQKDCRHALEFVEDWNSSRIAMMGSIPIVAATVIGIVWALHWGNVQSAFTVAGFVLTVGTALLALLAIVSNIES